MMNGQCKVWRAGDTLHAEMLLNTPNGPMTWEDEVDAEPDDSTAHARLMEKAKFVAGFFPAQDMVGAEVLGAAIDLHREYMNPETRPQASERIDRIKAMAADGHEAAQDLDYACERMAGFSLRKLKKFARRTVKSPLTAAAALALPITAPVLIARQLVRDAQHRPEAAKQVDAIATFAELPPLTSRMEGMPGWPKASDGTPAPLNIAQEMQVQAQQALSNITTASQATGLPLPPVAAAAAVGLPPPPPFDSAVYAQSDAWGTPPSMAMVNSQDDEPESDDGGYEDEGVEGDMDRSLAGVDLLGSNMLGQEGQTDVEVGQAGQDDTEVGGTLDVRRGTGWTDTYRRGVSVAGDDASEEIVGSLLSFIKKVAPIFDPMKKGGLTSGLVSSIPGVGPAIQGGMNLLNEAKAGSKDAIAKLSSIKDLANSGVPGAKAAMDNLRTAQGLQSNLEGEVRGLLNPAHGWWLSRFYQSGVSGRPMTSLQTPAEAAAAAVTAAITAVKPPAKSPTKPPAKPSVFEASHS